MNPLVSIVTPTYNHEKYIIECIQSVQAQSYTNWEMIIINDGSTDNTAELVAEYIKNEPRVRIYNQENIGIFRLGESYNFALSESKGKYISILEGDDLWESDKLELQVEILEENPAIVVAWGKAQTVNGDTKEIYNTHPILDENPFFFNQPKGNILNLLYIENCIPALTITIRKDSLLKVGGFIQNFNLPLVDLPTLLKLSLLGDFYFHKKVLGQWRIYANQVTKTFPVEIMKGRYDVAVWHYQKLPTEIKNQLEISEKSIHAHFNNIIMKGYAMSGRYKLIRKDFSSARKDYIRSLFYVGVFNPVWRLRALIGLIFSFFHLNIEGLAKLMGKKTYTR